MHGERPADAAAREDRADVANVVEIRALTNLEASNVPYLWNAAWEAATALNPYPLSAAVWRERLGSRHHEPSLLLGAFEAGQLVAVAYGKLPKSPWQPEHVGWLALLAVAPEGQGRGIGTRLTAHLLTGLAERGVTVVRFGADADHLLPGPPQEAGPALWRLLRRFGATFSVAEHDLHLDLRSELPPAPLPTGWRLRTDDPDGAKAFVSNTFPGRWVEELADYVAAGAVAITLEREGSKGADDSAGAKGFCAVFLGDERATSPGLIWAAALRREIGSQATGSVKLAGIGPLGIAPEARGGGVGMALVRSAAEYVRDRGATDLIINWTTLTGFYGRLGARLQRTYQRAEAPMPTRETLMAIAAGESWPGPRPAAEGWDSP